jgi:hypothetical protein
MAFAGFPRVILCQIKQVKDDKLTQNDNLYYDFRKILEDYSGIPITHNILSLCNYN